MAREITITTLYGDRYNVTDTSNTSCILAVRKADHLNIKRALRHTFRFAGLQIITESIY